MQRPLMFMDRKTLLSILSKEIYTFNVSPIKISMMFFQKYKNPSYNSYEILTGPE